jgi:hypothetical protein
LFRYRRNWSSVAFSASIRGFDQRTRVVVSTDTSDDLNFRFLLRIKPLSAKLSDTDRAMTEGELFRRNNGFHGMSSSLTPVATNASSASSSVKLVVRAPGVAADPRSFGALTCEALTPVNGSSLIPRVLIGMCSVARAVSGPNIDLSIRTPSPFGKPTSIGSSLGR